MHQFIGHTYHNAIAICYSRKDQPSRILDGRKIVIINWRKLQTFELDFERKKDDDSVVSKSSC